MLMYTTFQKNVNAIKDSLKIMQDDVKINMKSSLLLLQDLFKHDMNPTIEYLFQCFEIFIKDIESNNYFKISKETKSFENEVKSEIYHMIYLIEQSCDTIIKNMLFFDNDINQQITRIIHKAQQVSPTFDKTMFSNSSPTQKPDSKNLTGNSSKINYFESKNFVDCFSRAIDSISELKKNSDFESEIEDKQLQINYLIKKFQNALNSKYTSTNFINKLKETLQKIIDKLRMFIITLKQFLGMHVKKVTLQKNHKSENNVRKRLNDCYNIERNIIPISNTNTCNIDKVKRLQNYETYITPGWGLGEFKQPRPSKEVNTNDDSKEQFTANVSRISQNGSFAKEENECVVDLFIKSPRYLKTASCNNTYTPFLSSPVSCNARSTIEKVKNMLYDDFKNIDNKKVRFTVISSRKKPSEDSLCKLNDSFESETTNKTLKINSSSFEASGILKNKQKNEDLLYEEIVDYELMNVRLKIFNFTTEKIELKMEQLINLIECKTFSQLDFYSKRYLEYNDSLRLICNSIKTSFNTMKSNLQKIEKPIIKIHPNNEKLSNTNSLLKKRLYETNKNNNKSTNLNISTFKSLKNTIKNEVISQITKPRDKRELSYNLTKNNFKLKPSDPKTIDITLEITPNKQKVVKQVKNTVLKEIFENKITQNKKNVKKNSQIFDKIFGLPKNGNNRSESSSSFESSDKENVVNHSKAYYKKVKAICVNDKNGITLNSFKSLENLRLYQLCEVDKN